MKRRPKWSTVTIALAVIAALAIAIPAFGISKSIKKAIKKEVAQQIDKATGPAGPTGSPGTAGAPAPGVDSQLLSLGGIMDKGDAPKVLDTFGPFTFTATCVDAGAGVTQADVAVSTTADNGFLSSEVTDTDFDVADSPLSFMNLSSAVANAETSFESDLWDGQGSTGIKDGDGEHFGLAVNTAGADCRFFGYALGPNS